MKIEVAQGKLARALSVVSRVAMGAKATLPILSNVLIRVEDSKVSLTATNLDMAVVEYVPTISSENGVITVPARLLAEFVSNLPTKEKVVLETNDTKLKITAGKYSSTINGVPADDFPELPEIDEEKAVRFKMGVDEFKAGVGQVIVAVGGDTTRPQLTGVYFDASDGKLNVVGTDGYRIAVKSLVDDVKSEISAIVPAASLQEVMRSMADDMEEIELLFDETQVRFRMGEIEITSKLISGSYPDYKRIIPQDLDVEVEVDRSEMQRVAKMAAIFSRSGANRAITCATDSEKNIFSISSVSNEMGENKSEIETKVSKDAEIRIDAKYLLDALNVLSEEKIMIRFAGSKRPMRIENSKDNSYIHIVMPLNI